MFPISVVQPRVQPSHCQGGIVKKNKESSAAEIIDRLMQIRRNSGLTDAQMVQLSGMSNGWWHGLKKVSAAPHMSTVEKLALHLGLPLTWILNGGDEPDWVQFRERMGQSVTESRVTRLAHKWVPSSVVKESAASYGGQRNIRDSCRELAALLGVDYGVVYSKVLEIMNDQKEGEP